MKMSSMMSLALVGQAILSAALTTRTRNGGGLSILSKNNLDQEPLPGSAAILVHQADNYDAAIKHCDQVNEALWVHDVDAFAKGVGSSLANQVYIGNWDSDALFWIAGEPSCGCSAISINGTVRNVSCSKSLPALCTQSAPVSSVGVKDSSEKYQITQDVGDLTLTGYRDFFAWKFLGVRYAPEPLRFEYSEPLRGASGSATALDHRAPCLQELGEVREGASDDCLFASIWTPYLPSAKESSKAALKPVHVYFHGGGYTTGTAGNSNTDGTNFASRADVVVVSVNYRLGNAGMIVFDDGIHNGNVGVGDQVSALQWISENIAAFGGDPDRITIGGESAGAVATRLMMTTPLAQGLFQRALLRSDAAAGMHYPFGHFMSVEESYNLYTVNLLEAAGCTDAEDQISCMRELDGMKLATLLTNINGQARWPVVDGIILTKPQTPLNGTDPGFARDIPIIFSQTANEGGIYVSLLLQALPINDWGDLTSLEQFVGLLAMLGFDPSPILGHPELFGVDPMRPTGTQFENALERLISLQSFTCAAKAQMYSASLHGAYKTVYGLQFDRTYSPEGFTSVRCEPPRTEESPSGDPSADYWRCHAGDQLVSWGNIERVGLPDRDGLDRSVSQLTIDYFASFIYTGNPNPDREYLMLRGFEGTLDRVGQAGEWSPVDPVTLEWMTLSSDGGMEKFPDPMCDIVGQPLTWWEA